MKRFGIFVLSNLDTLVAIAICVLVAILGIFGSGQSVVLPAVAGVLGLLAYGLIRDRIAREDLLKEIRQFKSPFNAGEILKDRKSYCPLTETIDSAQLICFVGPSLVNIFSQYAGYLQHTKLTKHGAALQAIILDPNCSAIESTAVCMSDRIDNLRQDIENTVLRVRTMLQDGIGMGSIELRLMQVNPNYSLVLVDPYKSCGKLFIEFIGYHSRLHTRPHIELTRQHDKEWFEYFVSQYDELWQNSGVHLASLKREPIMNRMTPSPVEVVSRS